ncbi:LysM peptidoglycan-binding domain-containing protein [Streptomyces erythrochromogenes]|uniref:LysM peptidoglycan-binding domain-containing protein n=1 Tax=Streptomyces erythrochromogenes TaxID=285574 RepID=UPI0036B925D1
MSGLVPDQPLLGTAPGSAPVWQLCIVVRGDSLQSIATWHSGRASDWRRIAELNDIDDPSKLRPGSTLLLPGPGSY